MKIAHIVAQRDGWNHMGGWDGGWMWLWGVVMMLAFVALVVWIARSTGTGAQSEQGDPTARGREILAERFARGELTREEYREHIDELS